ncbi:RNA polymerase sigma factor RpoD/SigA [bacterium]|nr:RNA polymerase sigma factor RpoD/SigA [candidate division CSSED10-310 bacterium]
MTTYLSEINKYPLLSRDEEVELSERIQQGDEDALQRMVQGNLRFVVSIAKKYLGSGLQLDELVNEGSIGLIEAAKRFQPERGVKFITYAIWWVRQAILYAIATKTGIVKLPANQIQLLNMINKKMQSMTQTLGREPHLSELAAEINVPESEVENLLRTTRISLSIETHLDENEEEGPSITLTKDNIQKPEEQVIEDGFVDDVELLLTCLDDREKEILQLHYGFKGIPLTLQEIGNRYGLTRERIRKIELRAIEKLKKIAKKRQLEDYLK